MNHKNFFAFFLVFLIPLTIYNADALQQVAGPIDVEIKPGQSSTFEWGLLSDNQNDITKVKLSVEGEGAQFLSFPEMIELQPNEMRFTEITVNIPDDFPGDITLSPHLIGTEFGEAGGATVLNIRMLKIVTLNVAPNDDPSLWVDWDKVSLEPVVEDIVPVVPEAEQEATQTESPGFTIVGREESGAEPTCGAGTHLENGQCVPDQKGGGGCLIATAAFGSELAPQVQMLREVRDNTVLSTSSGTEFMTVFNQFYYSFSPTIADWQRENPMFRDTIRVFITPMITSLSIMTLVEQGSEEQVLGLGISVIALNLGMYIAAPTVAAYSLNRKLRKNKCF